jgi:hypothetical protein
VENIFIGQHFRNVTIDGVLVAQSLAGAGGLVFDGDVLTVSGCIFDSNWLCAIRLGVHSKNVAVSGISLRDPTLIKQNKGILFDPGAGPIALGNSVFSDCPAPFFGVVPVGSKIGQVVGAPNIG